MARSRIGPFALEAPLSSGGSSGKIYRGVHLEQRKLAAIRVFPIPMGLTPESRQAFSSQLDQLKQLRHQGIVRCYGGGFDTRKAFLAYQLVDGESLDRMLERRERLPWETALEYSQQIAEALQYAHQMGWVHGRLKPDKLIVSKEGNIKISDWRREAISTMIDRGQLDSSTKLFAAPEVLEGSVPDEKSDLYSVGALMFFMLTGGAPFDVEDDQLRPVEATSAPPDVATLVMDCPVWLSAVVKQLLSRDPSGRPYSATALQLAFKEAQRRQAEGVGVLQHATAGFSPLQLQADRAEAEKVLGVKNKARKKRRDETPFFEKTWVLLGGLVAAVAAIVWLLMPLSEASLRQRAEALLPPESQEWQDWNEARDDYLEQLVERFPDGSQQEWALSQIAWVNAREAERRLERENRLNRRSDWQDAERQYWNAREFEEFGDLLSALDRYRAVKALYGKQPESADIVYLADEGIRRIRANARAGSQLADFVDNRLREAERAYNQARLVEAREIWTSIVALYAGNQELAPQVAQAEQRLANLKQR